MRAKALIVCVFFKEKTLFACWLIIIVAKIQILKSNFQVDFRIAGALNTYALRVLYFPFFWKTNEKKNLLDWVESNLSRYNASTFLVRQVVLSRIYSWRPACRIKYVIPIHYYHPFQFAALLVSRMLSGTDNPHDETCLLRCA